MLFGASLCIWSAVENIENIVSPESGFAHSKERMEAVRKHALDRVAKRAHTQSSLGAARAWVESSVGRLGARARIVRVRFESGGRSSPCCCCS